MNTVKFLFRNYQFPATFFKKRLASITKANEAATDTASSSSQETMKAPPQQEEHDFEIISMKDIPPPEKLKAYDKGMR